MADETTSSKWNILLGLLAAAPGAFIIAGASGLFGLDPHPTDGTPQWVGISAGALFLAGGLAVMLRSLPAAKLAPDGSLAPDAPRWMQLISLALALFIAGDLAAVFLWIAFGPGERQFSTSGSVGGVHVTETLGGHANEIAGRVAFGFGAVFICLAFVAFLIYGVRQLGRRDQA